MHPNIMKVYQGVNDKNVWVNTKGHRDVDHEKSSKQKFVSRIYMKNSYNKFRKYKLGYDDRKFQSIFFLEIQKITIKLVTNKFCIKKNLFIIYNCTHGEKSC